MRIEWVIVLNSKLQHHILVSTRRYPFCRLRILTKNQLQLKFLLYYRSVTYSALVVAIEIMVIHDS